MIHIRKSKDRQFYFTVNGKNGRVILTSETYTRKMNCKLGIAAIFKLFGRTIKITDHTKK